jgi:hypothetical protein
LSKSLEILIESKKIDRRVRKGSKKDSSLSKKERIIKIIKTKNWTKIRIRIISSN